MYKFRQERTQKALTDRTVILNEVKNLPESDLPAESRRCFAQHDKAGTLCTRSYSPKIHQFQRQESYPNPRNSGKSRMDKVNSNCGLRLKIRTEVAQ